MFSERKETKINLKLFMFFGSKRKTKNKEFFLLPIFISNGIFNSQRSEKC